MPIPINKGLLLTYKLNLQAYDGVNSVSINEDAKTVVAKISKTCELNNRGLADHHRNLFKSVGYKLSITR